MESLAGYQVVEELHQSPRSVVVRCIKEGHHVVLKTTSAESPSYRDLAQYRYVYALLKGLEEPGICRPLALEELGSRPFLIMEDVRGSSLRKLVEKHRYSLPAKVKLAVQIADALGRLHSHDIIHKDLKLSNIVASEDLEQVQLIDFGLASRRSREILEPGQLHGTLAYMSPEQTGRMNRSVDHRSDLYSLGVLLYELFVGRLPFEEEDALAWVYSHMARHPTPPHELDLQMPLVLSQMVLKLMEKDPDDRYQSALGLKADLEICLKGLQLHGEVEPFALGAQDFSPKLSLSQKLYGRESEIQKLMGAFASVQQGAAELLLVSGYSGIGKTALVREVHKPIVRAQGRFISGKYDQFQNVPYAPIIQAFQQLIQQLLSEPEEQLELWRQALEEALHPVAQVIVDVIPEVELLLGPQPQAPLLPPTETKNRFHRAFRRFVQVFARSECPLVLFLDDLQWANSTSCELLRLLLLDANTQFLFLMGAYRDNEVDDSHPVMQMLQGLRETQVPITEIQLQPLALADVTQMVSDSLQRSPGEVQQLAEVLHGKTQGNPFFVGRFLVNLVEQGALRVDPALRRWRWELEEIQAMGITENVAELMSRELLRLPTATQDALLRAACIGNQFGLEILATVSGQPPKQLAEALWPAIQEEFLQPIGDDYRLLDLLDDESGQVELEYRFPHDRLQQAAYERLAAQQRAAIHLEIGRLLLQQASGEPAAEALFEIVNQLNLGACGQEPWEERLAWARLNERAGSLAMAATAYSAALGYLRHGIALLPDDAWSSPDEALQSLVMSLHMLEAEAALMSGEYDAAKAAEVTLWEQAQELEHKVQIIKLRIKRHELTSEHSQCVDAGLLGMQLFDFPVPESMEQWQQAAEEERQRLEQAWAGRELSDMVEAPDMTDPMAILETELLAAFAPLATTQPHMTPVIMTRLLRISVEHGNHKASPYAYVFAGFMEALAGDYRRADALKDASLALAEKGGIEAAKVPLYQMASAFVTHWCHPYAQVLEYLHKAIPIGLETGVFNSASWAAMNVPWQNFACGTPLLKAYEESEHFLYLMRHTFKYDDGYHSILGSLHPLLRLLGRDAEIQELEQAGESCEALHRKLDHYPMCNGSNYTLDLQAAYLLGEHQEALSIAETARPSMAQTFGLICASEFVFYEALARAAAWESAGEEQRQAHAAALEEALGKLRHWQSFCADNQTYKVALVQAKMAAIEGDFGVAADCFEQAIEAAQAQQMPHAEALALEEAARFYLSRDKQRLARGYLTDARYAYARWGADAKIAQLESQFPFLRWRQAMPQHPNLTVSISGSTSTSGGADFLDVKSIIKATQAISGAIRMEELLAQILSTVMENAGATRGFFLLREDGELWVEARSESREMPPQLLSRQPLDPQLLSASVIRFVARSRRNVVLHDASQSERFSHDPYIEACQPKSLLCSPILNQNRLLGVLYLENDLTTQAFTPERVLLLDVLSAQAAISIENARLYTQLEQKVAERTHELRASLHREQQQRRQLEEAQSQLVQSEKMASLGTLVAGVAHEINNPSNFILSGSQNLKRRLEEFDELLLELMDEDAEAEVVSMFRKRFDSFYFNLDAIVDGTQRIQEIVQGLRSFSRLDEASLKDADVIEGVETALTLLRANFHDTVQFNTFFPERPPIPCWPSELNQALMNIMLNGCQAIVDAQAIGLSKPPGQLHLRSYLCEDEAMLALSIQDDGVGMSEEITRRIFEPFFTTRVVGDGKGLGLSVAFGIVQKHQGRIEVQSTPQKGSTFTVLLPLEQRT